MARVLIVDDERSIRTSLKAFLLADGHKVEVATDAQEALRLLGGHEFSVVVSDVVLPGINGIELLQAIRGAAPFVQVVMITGEPTADTAAAALRSGAFDYLTKPVCKNAILRAVGNAEKVKAVDDERRRLEKRNRRQLVQLEKQNKELRQAAAFREEVEQIMRHDLKAPLNLVIGGPQLLLDMGDNLTREQRKCLKTIERSGHRMLEMINLSLDLFRIEQGMYTVHTQAVDLLAVLGEVLKHQEPLSRVCHARMEILFEGRSPKRADTLMIQGERLLSYTMLSNLVKNALEASPQGGKVTVELGTADTVTITIRNRGSVPREIRERFFEKHVTWGKNDGMGLGTYSAKLAAEAQGGVIRLDSSITDETTVFLSFPIDRIGAVQNLRPARGGDAIGSKAREGSRQLEPGTRGRR